MKSTPFHDYHVRHAKMTEFAGYDMPLWYTGIVEEHMAVRNSCGVFDVSHMGRAYLRGRDAGKWLESLVPTAVESQPSGKCVYSVLLNDKGGILDDFIFMKASDQEYLVVVNAANTKTDFDHILAHSQGFDATLDDITERSAMIAVQGPESRRLTQTLTSSDLSQLARFRWTSATILGSRGTISRTGYTGEDGLEVIIHDVDQDKSKAMTVWEMVVRTARPCGLGARDSLRIEAGYPLYGNDIDSGTNPIEADLGWVVAPGKAGYLGSKYVLDARAKGTSRVRRGIVLESQIPRHGFAVVDKSGREAGHVTSGTFSPVLKKGIALAYVSTPQSEPGNPIDVRVRDTTAQGRVVKPPFYDEKVYGWKRQGNGN